MFRIFDVVGQLTSFTVKPHIADHAMLRWKGSRGKRCMANDCFCIGILIMSVGEICSVHHEITESTLSKANAVTIKKISSQTIYCYL